MTIPISNNIVKIDSALSEHSNKAIQLTSQVNFKTENFQKYVQSNFSEILTSKKLQKWYKLDFVNFIYEYNKALKKEGKDKLSKSREIEWMEVFESKKTEIQALKAEIDKNDKEIDQMVYELYGLTDEEIKIVENS